MLEASVEMCLCRQKHNVLEMGVIDVCVDSEQSLEDDLDDCLEVAREGDTQCTWEDLFIV